MFEGTQKTRTHRLGLGVSQDWRLYVVCSDIPPEWACWIFVRKKEKKKITQTRDATCCCCPLVSSDLRRYLVKTCWQCWPNEESRKGSCRNIPPATHFFFFRFFSISFPSIFLIPRKKNSLLFCVCFSLIRFSPAVTVKSQRKSGWGDVGRTDMVATHLQVRTGIHLYKYIPG